jgi:antiviral helicase SLH1
MEWLSYTYLVLRMRRNPLQYGLTTADVEDDPQLARRR